MFFIRQILDPDHWEALSLEQQDAVKQYLRELRDGPADGEMDIEWQETGRSYYVHLHKIAELKEPQKGEYLGNLRADIEVCLSLWPDNYVVTKVAGEANGYI